MLPVLTDGEIRHLLVVCAYRDGEVDAGHLLTWALDRLEAAHASLDRMALAPLRLEDLVPFLCDTLHSAPGAVTRLAELVRLKTDGNPFFVIQFLRTLYQDGFFSFDRGLGRWTFRIEAIAGAGMTDNVIDLMTRKIRRLSPAAQYVLMLTACIGNQFEWSTFLTVSRQPPEDAAAGLAKALEARLVRPAGQPYEATEGGASGPSAYAFLHDRVQQAAYGEIPEARRKPVHLDVGRLMLAQYGDDPSNYRIFEMVNHLNIGSDLTVDPAEGLRGLFF